MTFTAHSPGLGIAHNKAGPGDKLCLKLYQAKRLHAYTCLALVLS